MPVEYLAPSTPSSSQHSSESSSTRSPSPRLSPTASQGLHNQELPDLEKLVLHFVSAKRSLGSASHVSRANELVTGSRCFIEEIAILQSRCAFARHVLDEQVVILDAINDGIVADTDDVSAEFDATLAALDEAHLRLERTLESLRKSVIDPSLRESLPSTSLTASSRDTSSQPSTEDSENTGPGKASSPTLFDFIDDQTHEELLEALRRLIDSYHFAYAELEKNSLSGFNDAIKVITDGLSGAATDSGDYPPDKPTIYDEPPLSLAQLFRSMEEQATQMASLLADLVKHYDLTVAALRQTEGGGEAARRALQTEDLSSTARPNLTGAANPMDESLYRAIIPIPVSDEERNEMLAVIHGDAQEVEEVVLEIRDGEAEMETRYQQLSKHAQKARCSHQTLRRVHDRMQQLRAALPMHLDAVSGFHETWHTIRADMRSKTDELTHLSAFYDHFLAGYAQLLREVARRQTAETQMRKVADRARAELARLHAADQHARDVFMDDVGEFLPRDIWPRLADRAPCWDVRMSAEDLVDAKADVEKATDVSSNAQ